MSRSKQKGTAAETAVVRALQRLGWPEAERRALAGSLDKGDVTGVPGVCFEVKDTAEWHIPAWMRETEEERVNSNASIGILVIKVPRVGHDHAEKWLTVMDDFDARLLCGSAATGRGNWREVSWPHLPPSWIRSVERKTMAGLRALAELKERERHCGDTPVMLRVRKTLSKHVTEPGFWNFMRLDARCRLLVDAGYGGYAIMDETTSNIVKENGNE